MTTSKSVQLDVEGMTCDSCAIHVRRALQQVPHVHAVDVPGWQSGQATLVADASIADEDLVGAVEVAGYRASVREHRTREDVGAFVPNGTNEDFDLMVIGGGSAAFAAAIKAGELGARVAMVEKSTIGGTCVNRGCVPSKTLIRAMEQYHLAGTDRFRGVHTAATGVEWSAVVAQKNALVDTLREEKYVDVVSAYPEITFIEGEGRLTDDDAVVVGDRTYRPAKVVLATGAHPWAPPIPGLDEAGYLTSTTVMELEELPHSMIVLGANAVGLELAQTFARAGTDVTVIELLDRIVPFEDDAISEALETYLVEEGLSILTGATTKQVNRRGDDYTLTVELADGAIQDILAERLLVATGRRPNTSTIGLEDAGVETDSPGAIVVNEYGQTSNPNVYAAGDCTALPMFVYVAAHSGTVAAENALAGNRRQLDPEALPKVTFTDPQVASAGLIEREARAEGYDVKVATLPLEHVPRALAARDTRGLIKLVADAATDRLLGAHVLASEAGEVIQTAVLALRAGYTTEQLASTIFPYLTTVEGLKLAAQTFEKDVAMLSCCAG